MKKYLLGLAVLSACTSSQSTGITSDNLTCPPGSALTYANYGADWISTNCLSCHATKEKPTLSTQAQVRSNLSRILDAAVYTTAMPENADLTTDERRRLGEWLTCGAP